jgi:hypothetical protein
VNFSAFTSRLSHCLSSRMGMMSFRSRRYRLKATLYASYNVVLVTGGGVSHVAINQLFVPRT